MMDVGMVVPRVPIRAPVETSWIPVEVWPLNSMRMITFPFHNFDFPAFDTQSPSENSSRQSLCLLATAQNSRWSRLCLFWFKTRTSWVLCEDEGRPSPSLLSLSQ